MLQVTDLVLHKGDFTLGKLSLEVPEQSYFVILGRTGSGKTLLLESIAGLQQIQGEIHFDGVEISGEFPEQRGFGFVYQDLALFPHMSVEDNIRFASRFREVEGLEALYADVTGFLEIEGCCIGVSLI